MTQLPVRMHLNPVQSAILGLPKAVAAPKNVFYEATELEKQGDYHRAGKVYRELLNADFDNPVILAAYGMNCAAQEQNGLAYSLLTRALEKIDDLLDGFKRLGVVPKAEKLNVLDEFATSKRSEILNAIGTCWKHENKTELARKYFEEAQALIPTNPDIQNNLATLYINEGDPEKALSHLDSSLSIMPSHPQAQWNKSLVLLEMGDYKGGWDLYDAGHAAKVRTERDYAGLPVWDGSPGKTIVVYGEQGIGDEIMFASCLNPLIQMSKQVVFDCHKKLHSLFASSFPNLDIYPTREDQIITWTRNAKGQLRYPFDARIAIGSLPKFFLPDLASFPGERYINPSEFKELEWGVKLAALGDKPKIGISWVGGHKRTRIEVRSVELEKLLPILKQDATFISLQYTDCVAEIEEFKAKHKIDLHYFPEATHSENYDDTAALVANLDLVITVCTSVVHLAGSMGVPTWVLTPSRPAWRYRLDLDYMPWYGKSVTLFRQATGSIEWEPVIEEVAGSLSELLHAE